MSMSESIKLGDGSSISFEKEGKKFFMKICIPSQKKTITLNLNKQTINLILFAIEDLFHV